MAPTLKDEYPEIQAATRYFPLVQPLVEYSDNPGKPAKFYEENVLLADSTFFDVFKVIMVDGDPETALDFPYSIVLSESQAKKYFGNRDPIDKLLRFENKEDLIIWKSTYTSWLLRGIRVFCLGLRLF